MTTTAPRPFRRLTGAPAVDRVLLAAVGAAVLYHGVLLASGTFRRTYDALIHIFFADHYRRWWFDHWEPRWYTGFPITSYPPGSHQLTALLAHGIGLEWAFVLVQLTGVVLLVIGVHRFASLWVDRRAAGMAAVLTVLSTSVAETVHVFGQLPTILSLGFLLNATPWVHRWIVRGARRDLAAAVAVTAATTAAHHVTTLFGAVFVLGPVIVHALLLRLGEAWQDETPTHPAVRSVAILRALAARRLRRVLRPTARAAGYAVALVTALILVVLPYWLWSATDPITQLPIPHGSRADFLEDLNAGLVFWLIPWGPLLLLLPLALRRGWASSRWPLAASVSLLTLLGTGGTTPLPRLLLGGAFDILTLDRFTFWATILVLPLAGEVVADFPRSRAAERLRLAIAGWAPTATALSAVSVAVLASIATTNLTLLRPMQPAWIDPEPIVSFLSKDDHDRWRYLTLGFGDQMAWLAANTTAQTVDGNYHSARRLPELITTPVERLEGAKFRGVPGIGSLQQFLTVPERYHLKYVFSNDAFYDPLLHANGWHRLDRLVNGVVVWERADITPLPELLPRREIPMWQRILWGTLPMTALVAAAVTLVGASLRFVRDRRVPEVPVARPATGPLARVEAALHRLARLPSDLPETGGPRVRARLAAVAAGLHRVATSTIATAVLVTLGATLPIAVAFQLRPTEPGPGDVVEAYHLALDLGRDDEAWDLLDPATRPPLDEYLLHRSVRDGLLAGYASLDGVLVREVAIVAGRATVLATTTHITALHEHVTEVQHDLVRTPAGWRILAAAVDVRIPPERFASRPAVDYLLQGRRRVTTGRTDHADVLDRPEVAVTSARLVEYGGRLHVVGEVVNTDVRPADVTVTAQLLDPDGRVLTSYDAGQVIVHELLPKGATGFRVTFEGVAGALDVDDPAAGTFSPGASSPYALGPDDDVAAVHVYAKAVVTGDELGRPLALQRVALDGPHLRAELLNIGVVDATIPRILTTWYDDDGVAWVDVHVVDVNVRPGRLHTTSWETPDPDQLHVVDVEVLTFDNGLIDRAWAVVAPAPDLSTPGSGFAGARFVTTAFTRTGA